MENTFRYYNNDGRGPGRLCYYFNPCPKWYDKCHKDDSKEMKTLSDNWFRFCDKYKVKKVFNDIPFLRIIGSRCYHLEEHFREIWSMMVDHRLTILTEDGRYLLIGSNYTGNSELESRYDKDSYCLGEYKGFKYVLKRTILGPEYSFYNVSPSNNCLTFVWECFKTPVMKKVEKVSEMPRVF